MAKSPSPIWQAEAPGLLDGLSDAIDKGLAGLDTGNPARVFFRADDIGVPGDHFERLMATFTRHRAPLGLAVVPTWLTESRWRHLEKLGAEAPGLWCWHHHGWRHVNHETEGKKQEFGEARPTSALHSDLLKGREHLSHIMGNAFYPLFTPPWNRICAGGMESLVSLGYRAISRSAGSRPPAPERLPDIPINVDLHTRKEPDPALSAEKLLGELTAALSSGTCGIMIHHLVMNGAAFEFLDRLIEALAAREAIRFTGMAELAESCHI